MTSPGRSDRFEVLDSRRRNRRTATRLWVFGLSLVGLFAFASGCTFDSNLGSAGCQTDDDCSQNAFCREGYCVRSDAARCPDQDGDGAPARKGCGGPVDCDDSNARRTPGRQESCDGLDNDCDGEIDEGVQKTFYKDGDRDSYGSPETTESGCSPSPQFVAEGGDCDDEDPAVNPGESEICNGVDDDCDGVVDNLPGTSGSGGDTKTNCGQCGIDCTAQWEHAAEVACNGGACELVDCANPYFDLDGEQGNGCEYECEYAEMSGGTLENDDATCDDLDNDCDGTVDEDFAEFDSKGDSCSVGQGACETTGSLVGNDSEDGVTCNAEPKEPQGAEICDDIDNDCDGEVDNAPQASSNTTTHYRDRDDDGYGVQSETLEVCNDDSPPSGWAPDKGDCKPGDSSIYPGASEQCNGEDDDCDGDVDEPSQCICEYGTQRTFGSNTGACEEGIEECRGTNWVVIQDDVEPSTEICDDLDNDCDGNVNGIFRCGGCATGKRQTCDASDTNWSTCSSHTESQCSDGVDNDCDGKTDSNDSDC